MKKSSKNYRLIFNLLLSCLFLSLCGCGTAVRPLTRTALLLDTVVTVTYYDPADAEAVDAALALCTEYEAVFSRTQPDSELSRLNAAGRMEVSEDLAAVLALGLEGCALSDGRFDLTMGGVSALYGFSSPTPSVPTADALAEALSHVGWERVRLDGSTVTRDDSAAVIDLGAIAKGYIADRMKALLLSHGVEHALLDLGGNVLCLGGRPDGTDYAVGIRAPDGSGTAAVVHTAEGSVVTSGTYERCFTADGQVYHHLLDSATGDSIRNGLASVSVFGPESARCDLLSTVCFALGPEDGMALIDRTEGYSALFITEDGTLLPSADFPKQ